jgi:hypothetical protein
MVIVRNLFDSQGDFDRCPMCGAPSGSCNDYLNNEKLLNPDPGALVLVTEDIYEDVQQGTEMVPRLKWRAGELIRTEEADRLGVRDVPIIVRWTNEAVLLQEALSQNASPVREQDVPPERGQGGPPGPTASGDPLQGR